MPQIFQPKFNTYARISLFGGIFALVGLIGLGWVFYHSSYINRVGVAVDQPIPFAHDLHVAGLGLDCRFCHVSVEKSKFADFPPTHTCMTCHSQVKLQSPALAPLHAAWESGLPIAWNRVYALPDYVNFNHEIHVAKGVGCETCHGRVDQMRLIQKNQAMTMSWCLECHRNPAKNLRPREAVFQMGYQPQGDQLTIGRQLVQEYNIHPPYFMDDCSLCHY